jgi:O-antigen/teichoic acid export membrane protein
MQCLGLNILGLFSTAFIIRQLGALQYGQWATAAALASAHLILTSAGLRPVFVRNVARRPEHACELLAEQLALRMVLGGLAAASAMAIAFVLRYPPVVIACMAVGSVWIMLSVISSTLGDLLHSLEKFGSYSVTNLISGLAVTAASIVAVHQGSGPIGLSIAYLTAPAVNVLLYWHIASKHIQVRVRWDLRGARALLRESRFMAFSQIATAARDRTEQLLVPRFAGLEAFGILSAGVIVADRLGNIPDAICTAFYPRISRAAQRSSGASRERTVTTMFTIALAASVPLAIVGMYLARPLSEILLPGASDICRSVIQISVWAVPLLAMSFGISFSLQAAGRHERVAQLGLRATGVSAALSIALVATFGIPGATWSLLARPAIVAMTLLPLFGRTFPAVLPAVPLGRILLSNATLAGICLLTGRQRIIPALIVALIGIGTYGVALLAGRVFPISAVTRLYTQPLDSAFTGVAERWRLRLHSRAPEI